MSRPRWREPLVSLGGLAMLPLLAVPQVHYLSEANLAVHHALHWALGVDGVTLGILWSRRILRFGRFAVPALALGTAIQLTAHIPAVWIWAVLRALTHGTLHALIFVGGLLIGAGFGMMGSIGRAWFVLLAGALMAPITLGMLAGGISYPPYPKSQSEIAGVVMLVAMQSLWLLALPSAPSTPTSRLPGSS